MFLGCGVVCVVLPDFGDDTVSVFDVVLPTLRLSVLSFSIGCAGSLGPLLLALGLPVPGIPVPVVLTSPGRLIRGSLCGTPF